MTGPNEATAVDPMMMLPYFRKAEHEPLANGNDDFDDNLHGVGGPLNVAEVRTRYEALDRLIEVAETIGYPHNKDYNGATQDGFGYYQVTQKNGLRFSAKSLQPNRKRQNLPIITMLTLLLSFLMGSMRQVFATKSMENPLK